MLSNSIRNVNKKTNKNEIFKTPARKKPFEIFFEMTETFAYSRPTPFHDFTLLTGSPNKKITKWDRAGLQ